MTLFFGLTGLIGIVAVIAFFAWEMGTADELFEDGTPQ